MGSGFASAFTKVSAWAEAVCRDKQGILQSLSFPMVNVWKCWSTGSDTNELKIEKLKIKRVNVRWMQIKMEMPNVVAKGWGSAIGDSALIFLSNRLSFLTLHSLRVFPVAFTWSNFAVTSVLASINSVISLALFWVFMFLILLLVSLFEPVLSYWL